jgi:hypothetical protein
MGKWIISYQKVLRTVIKNVNHKTVEVINCNHNINGQLLKTSFLKKCLCFGAQWNFCLTLNCDSWEVEVKLNFWISLVLSFVLSAILNPSLGTILGTLFLFNP